MRSLAVALCDLVCLLTAALTQVWRTELNRISSLADGGEGWTDAQYADAALQLLRSEHHAVNKAAIKAVLGRHIVGSAAKIGAARLAGAPVLDRLVEANALSVRPFSLWANDIPLAAFGPNCEDVVTAPSTLSLWCMGRLEAELTECLQHWEQQQQPPKQTLLPAQVSLHRLP